MDKNLVQDYTSRKFILAILAMGQVSYAFFSGKLTVEYWLGALGVCVFGYGALNLISKVLDLIREAKGLLADAKATVTGGDQNQNGGQQP